MRFARVIALMSVVLAGCLAGPSGRLPEGTYRSADGAPGVLVVNGDSVTFHLASGDHMQQPRSWGRLYPFDLEKDGSIRFRGSSNDSYYLAIILDCRWHWNGAALECRRDDGKTTIYARQVSDSPMAPATREQQVWLATAQFIAKNKAAAGIPGPLSIYQQTWIPTNPDYRAQVKRQARRNSCGDDTGSVPRVVAFLFRYDERSLSDVFEWRTEFQLSEQWPGRADSIGLSSVVFDDQRRGAYVSIDYGGLKGSVVWLSRENDQWTWQRECWTWSAT
jgi:hypothetical protein